ncbi:MAG TPA: 3-hydroxyacyl-CoA dehydrogenase family protein, partial [Pirellulales bacterium]|nr:3-hydroxyacyl-CoA dehydrogenase family protein [Pirellulales bacterium]
PQVEQLIAATATQAGIARRAITPSEIVERTIYALVNEAAQILAEGIALRALDIDVIYINGYGFPAHRGGPMWYADMVGLDRVYARIKEFERQHGASWTPAPLLAELAESGRTFADYDRSRSEGL